MGAKGIPDGHGRPTTAPQTPGAAPHHAARRCRKASKRHRGRRLKRTEVQAQLLEIHRAGEPYPGALVLAARLNCSRTLVQGIINDSPALRGWRIKAGLLGGPKRTRGTIRAQLLEIRRRGEPYPGARGLAARLGCSRNTIPRVIDASPALKAWRDGATFAQTAGLPAEDMNDKDELPVVGLICPSCHGREFKIIYTRRTTDGIIRRRQCRTCALRLTTVETIRWKSSFQRRRFSKRDKQRKKLTGPQPEVLVGDASMLSPAELAELFDVPYEPLRTRLARLRKTDHRCFLETANPAPREPHFLYKMGKVRHIIDALRRKTASSERSSGTSSERSAKKE